MAESSSDVNGDLGELKFKELCRAGSRDVAQPIPDPPAKDSVIRLRCRLFRTSAWVPVRLAK